jgi:hypothetical protein
LEATPFDNALSLSTALSSADESGAMKQYLYLEAIPSRELAAMKMSHSKQRKQL